MLVGGNHEQKKKYLGRMTEEPLQCVRNIIALHATMRRSHFSLYKAKVVTISMLPSALYLYCVYIHFKLLVVVVQFFDEYCMSLL